MGKRFDIKIVLKDKELLKNPDVKEWIRIAEKQLEKNILPVIEAQAIETNIFGDAKIIAFKDTPGGNGR